MIQTIYTVKTNSEMLILIQNYYPEVVSFEWADNNTSFYITTVDGMSDNTQSDILQLVSGLKSSTYSASTVSLSDNQKRRVLDIDTKTRAIIADGFSFDGQSFSLSQQAQMNWLGLITMQAYFSWPLGITTEANTTYSLSQANLLSFFSAGAIVIQTAVGTGRALKIAVNAATTQEQLDAVVDSR